METGAPDVERKERPKSSARSRPGRPFPPNNAGKPKGTKDRRTIVSQEVSRALAGKAVDVVERLLGSGSPRVRLEAARTVLAYAWGLPKQQIDITGGAFGEVVSELAAALRAAREARATALLEKPAAPALADGVIDAEPIEAPECKEKPPSEIPEDGPHG
jgi:hypothetical protein